VPHLPPGVALLKGDHRAVAGFVLMLGRGRFPGETQTGRLQRILMSDDYHLAGGVFQCFDDDAGDPGGKVVQRFAGKWQIGWVGAVGLQFTNALDREVRPGDPGPGVKPPLDEVGIYSDR